MAEPTRREVREGVAVYFGGAVLSSAGWYQPTPLVSAGLAGVRPYYEIRIDDHEYTATLAAGRGMGALMCLHLPEYTEKRLTLGGFMDVPTEVQLWLFHLARKPTSSEAAADLDDLVQAVIARIRADPTLGGAVTQAGETSRGISVSMARPVTEPGTPPTIRQEAVISFAANTYPFYATP